MLCLKENESFVISQRSTMHNFILNSSINTQSWKICTPNICFRKGGL